MQRSGQAVLEEFESHLDDALDAAVSGEAGRTLAAADGLTKALPIIEAWREQVTLRCSSRRGIRVCGP